MGGALLLAYIYHKGLKKYKIATIIITCSAILLSILVAISEYIGYKQIVDKIENGEIKIEEGNISEYQAIDKSNHGSFESFSLNGVKFYYSDYHRIKGYHHACANGGVICEEQQEIRIAYYSEKELNYIVKIELIRD